MWCKGDAERRKNITYKQLFVSGVPVVFFSGQKDTVGFCPPLLMRPSNPKVIVVN